eukprot:223553_1
MADKKQVELTIELTNKKEEEDTKPTTTQYSTQKEDEESIKPFTNEPEESDESDESEDSNHEDQKSPVNKGIEFDRSKSPLIYVLFGSANICINNDIISCKSSIDKLTTIKTIINKP